MDGVLWQQLVGLVCWLLISVWTESEHGLLVGTLMHTGGLLSSVALPAAN